MCLVFFAFFIIAVAVVVVVVVFYYLPVIPLKVFIKPHPGTTVEPQYKDPLYNKVLNWYNEQFC